MKSLVEIIRESILDNIDVVTKDDIWLQLTEVEDLQPFAEFLKSSGLSWEVDDRRSEYDPSELGKCVVVSISKELDCVFEFLGKDCSEVLYRLENNKTHESMYSTYSTIPTYNMYKVEKWENFFEWKSKFRKKIADTKKAMKKLDKYDIYRKNQYEARIAKFEKIIKML